MAQLPKSFKEAGFILILLFLVSVGIYWIIEQVNKNQVTEYLSALSKNLVDMVPKNEDKNNLEKKVDDFLKKVDKREISPQKVEEVAATILNLSKDNQTIAVEKADSILNRAIYRAPEIEEKIVPEQEWIEIGNRLEAIIKFEKSLDQKKNELSVQYDSIKSKIKYDAKNGIKIIVDPKIKSKSEIVILEPITDLLKKVEEKKILVWSESAQKNFENLDKTIIELQKLKEVKEIKSQVKNALNHSIAVIDSVIAADSLSRIKHRKK